MLRRLREPKDEHDDPRGELDSQLEVTIWRTPWTKRYSQEDVPANAPTWWHGEEEATDTFFKAMGIDPSKLATDVTRHRL